MILYNVTLNVEGQIKDEWLIWMKEVHIPEVMATGKFTKCEMYKIKNHEPEDNENNYSVQYHASSLKQYEEYLKYFAPQLKRKTIEKYGEKVLAFRTILEKVF